ncbi:hypothetical protein G173_gp240 [Erwinia phage phiEaH2]|uniref:Uncharacterized protein n=1 Tax=Erwinia phage phiEaH2 TaxID=1029988 RepID=J7KKW6_9CAUD|nr:hypothetical protein G173_gp240 [Erwinia phage phiEaH2]AFQ96785.1 hypothetical protein [Erwinia phage phiEaH2]
MRTINLQDVKDIDATSTPLMNELSILTMSNGEEIVIPRPVMLGLALFVHAAYGAASKKSILNYDGYQFVIPDRLDYQPFIDLQMFYKYLISAGLSHMSKVYIRDYSRIEHFYRRKQERVPVEVDGYQTRLIMKPHSFELLECELDIEQHQLRNDLMRGYNLPMGEVKGLRERSGDANWWANSRAAK